MVEGRTPFAHVTVPPFLGLSHSFTASPGATNLCTPGAFSSAHSGPNGATNSGASASATQPPPPPLPLRCDTNVILHEISTDDMATLFRREGPPLHLADAFISETCAPGLGTPPPAAPADQPCYAVDFVFNVKVFEFENGTKLSGAARRKQMGHQHQVYRTLTGGAAQWRCSWSGTQQARAAFPLVIDNHHHSLVSLPLAMRS